jgi:hypothetical protein
VQITQRLREDLALGRVVKAQGWVDGVLRQKLVLVNPALMDQEDMLEGLCWLLLNRYAIHLQTIREREEKLPEFPDWFSVGLAQNLYPASRARNVQVMAEQRKAEQAITVETLLTKEYLPAGRWPEKAAAGLFFSWLRAQQDTVNLLVARVADGQPITFGTLENLLADRFIFTGLEREWTNWLIAQQRVERRLGEVTEKHVDSLRMLLIVDEQETGRDDEVEGPPVHSLEDLIRVRDESWVPRFVAHRRYLVQQLGSGRSESYRKAVAMLDEYLQEVGLREGGMGTKESYRPRQTPENLKIFYAEVVQSIENVESDKLRQKRFLDEVDKVHGNTPPEVTRFLDQVEDAVDLEKAVTPD